MRVLLTAPPIHDLSDPSGEGGHISVCPSLGLYLLTAVIEEKGHEVDLVDPVNFEARFNGKDVMEGLAGADVLALSVNSCTWPRALALLKRLEDRPKRPVVVVGGPHASVLGEHVLRESVADFAVRGEAEISFPLLLEKLGKGEDARDTPGVSSIVGGDLVRNSPPELLTPLHLENLPPPRYDLLPDGYYDLLPVESSRGCLHACVFCSTTYRRSWRGIGPGAFRRRLDQLSPFLPKTKRGAFFIIDDCFTAGHERIGGIAAELAGFEHKLLFEARITDVIAPGIMEALVSLPILVMEMGVECGYQDGLSRAGKGLRLEQVEAAARLVDLYGLAARSRFSFIMGLPWEGKREVMKTLEYAFKLTGSRGAKLVASWLVVFPGSVIWNRRREWGVDIEAVDYDEDGWWSSPEVFRRCHPLLDPGRDLADIVTYAQMMMRLFPKVRHDGWFRHLQEQ